MTVTRNQTIIAFLLFILVFVITHFSTFPGSVEYFKEVTNNQMLLDLHPEFSVSKVYERLNGFGEEGRTAYLKLVPTIDLIFPVSAFIFLLLFGQLATQKFNIFVYSSFYWVLPAMYLLLDFLENISIVLILINYPDQIEILAGSLGFISVAKRIFMSASFMVPSCLLALATIRCLKRHSANKKTSHGT